MNREFWSYIAGFLDADGSIYVQLKNNPTYKYKYQVAPSIVFYQKKKENPGLDIIHQKLKLGYIRLRKDGMQELVINDRKSINLLLFRTLPYLILKQSQAQLMIKILKQIEVVSSADDFLSLAKTIDLFRELNYSKRRTVDSQAVYHSLINLKLLTP